MRKILYVIISVLLALGLCSCSFGAAQIEKMLEEKLSTASVVPSSSASDLPVEGSAVVTQGTSAGSNTIEAITSNIYYTADATEGDDFVIVLENHNNVTIPYLEINVVYYAQNGSMIDTETSYLYSFLPGKSVALGMDMPYDDDTYELLPFASYDVFFNPYMDSFYLEDNLIDNLAVQSNVGTDGVIVLLTNNSSAVMDSVDLSCVYFRSGDIVGFDWNYAYDLVPGASTSLQFYFPYDTDYNDVSFDSYAVYVNAALSYGD